MGSKLIGIMGFKHSASTLVCQRKTIPVLNGKDFLTGPLLRVISMNINLSLDYDVHSIAYSSKKDVDKNYFFKYNDKMKHSNFSTILLYYGDLVLENEKEKELLKVLFKESREDILHNVRDEDLNLILERECFNKVYEDMKDNEINDVNFYNAEALCFYSYLYHDDKEAIRLGDYDPIKLEKDVLHLKINEINPEKMKSFFNIYNGILNQEEGLRTKEQKTKELSHVLAAINQMHSEFFLDEKNGGYSYLTINDYDKSYYQIIEYKKYASKEKNNINCFGVITKLTPNGKEPLNNIIKRTKKLKKQLELVEKGLG